MKTLSATLISGSIFCAATFSCNSGVDSAKNQKIIDSLVQRQTFIADSLNLSYKTTIDSLTQTNKTIIDSLSAPKAKK